MHRITDAASASRSAFMPFARESNAAAIVGRVAQGAGMITASIASTPPLPREPVGSSAAQPRGEGGDADGGRAADGGLGEARSARAVALASVDAALGGLALPAGLQAERRRPRVSSSHRHRC